MKKVQKLNVVLSVEDDEVEYYTQKNYVILENKQKADQNKKKEDNPANGEKRQDKDEDDKNPSNK